MSKPRPPRITGLAHIFAAATYSLGGIRRLWSESAFRHEMIALPILLALYTLLGANAAQMCIFLGLFLLLIAAEAVNTALEVLADHLSPDWSIFARDTKDLGSLSVMCILLMHGLLLGYVALA